MTRATARTSAAQRAMLVFACVWPDRRRQLMYLIAQINGGSRAENDQIAAAS